MRALAQVLSAVIACVIVAACLADQSSHLVVYNETTVPIVFYSNDADYYVAPCSIARYVTPGSQWRPDPSAKASPMAGAVRVAIDAPFLPDAPINVTAWVMANGTLVQDSISNLHQGPCEGVPASPNPKDPYLPPPGWSPHPS